MGSNSDQTDACALQNPHKKILFARTLTGFWLLLAAALSACRQTATDEGRPPETPSEPSCGVDSGLKATLIGGIEADLDWSQDELDCESMRRPDAKGLRLRFSGDVAGERLAIIIAMPDLACNRADGELPSNVTVSVEGSGRFFSTPDLDSCWTDIISQERLPKDTAGNVNRYTIIGTLYCVAPLGELNGDSAVSIPELSFTSIADWSSK